MTGIRSQLRLRSATYLPQMGVERYRATASAVVEVEDPDALLFIARQRFVSGAPQDVVGSGT